MDNIMKMNNYQIDNVLHWFINVFKVKDTTESGINIITEYLGGSDLIAFELVRENDKTGYETFFRVDLDNPGSFNPENEEDMKNMLIMKMKSNSISEMEKHKKIVNFFDDIGKSFKERV